MTIARMPALQISRTSTTKSTKTDSPGHKDPKADGKSVSKALKSIKEVIFGDKNHKTRPVQCRPVDEEREKREYRALLRKRIAEREKLRKVR